MSNQLLPCGCNGINTALVCGAFEEPVNPDQGQCHSLRVKLDCEAPELPTASCGDSDFTISYDPDATKKFTVTAILRDQNCQPVLDDGGNTIETQST